MNIDTSLLPPDFLPAATIVLFIALMAGSINSFFKGTSETISLFKKKSATQAVIAELQQSLDVSTKLGAAGYETHKRDVDRYIKEVLSARLFHHIRLAERELDGSLYSSIIRFAYRTINRPIFIILYGLFWAWWVVSDSPWTLQSLTNTSMEGFWFGLAVFSGVLVFALLSIIMRFLINKDLDKAEAMREMRQSAAATGSVEPSFSHARDIAVDQSVTVHPVNSAARGEGDPPRPSPPADRLA